MDTAGDWHTLIISSEQIHSRLHQLNEIERMLSFFRDAVDDIVVVAVLRRQDNLAVSRFSTAIRAGHTDFDTVFDDISAHAFTVVPQHRSVDDMTCYYDYSRLLDRFVQILGEQSIRVHLYEEEGTRLDSIAMIDEYLGGALDDYERPEETLNHAMSAGAQFVIAALNRRFPSRLPDGRRNAAFFDFKRQVEAEMTGSARLVGRGEAEAFAAHFATSNDWVRRRFFSDRTSLFDNDFGMYPERVDYSHLADQLAPRIAEYIAAFEAQRLAPRHRGTMRRLMSSLGRAVWRVVG
jgi:hypothetical protein